MTSAIERVRTLGTSLDGSLLDDATWRVRHRNILICCSALLLYLVVYSLTDLSRSGEWVYVAVAVAMVLLSAVPVWGRRPREVLIAFLFLVFQLYTSRFVGRIAVGPLAIVMVSFYQDWVPIGVGCLLAAALAAVAVADPSIFHGTALMAPEDPGVDFALRTVMILLAAVLALAIWRAGTQAARDQLTGTLSRLGAEGILDREIQRGRRPAVWVCDLDNFSAINRQLGAGAGDSVLRYVARRLRRAAGSLGRGSITARLGGDTFLIAARNASDPDAVEEFAHRIEAQVGTFVNSPGSQDVPVRLSVGAAIAAPDETASHLLLTAEHNMRAAKGRGALRVVVDRSSERTVATTRSLLSSELYDACERGELELHIQPIVSLADGLPVGGETLARWNHPQRGLVYPIDFLPEAERDSALMAVISNTLGDQFHELVFGFATRHGPEWLPYGLSFNLAALRLRDPTLTTTLVSDFERTGLRGTRGRVNVEVTEGALMEVDLDVPAILGAFRAAGYHLALDDFGTGHSSLAHLRDFPLDTVKVDMSFVRSMGRSPIDRAVVEAVADIASVSGLTVIAEGVETTEQRDMLLAIKPDMLAQGWLYGKAMPVAQFESWVLQRRSVTAA